MKNPDIAASRFKGLSRCRVGTLDLPVADRPLSRLLGLALLEPEQAWPGLLIPNCRSIHSFGMRFPLHIFFLDRAGRPLRGVTPLPPKRLASCWGAHSVLELVPGRTRVMGAAALATLLICEDDHLTLELLCENLSADRFHTLAAGDAETALRLARTHQPDLLLLDLGLPDASGLDLLRTIRDRVRATERLDPALPVILISGSNSQLDRLRCLESGADDFLQKPVVYTELLARIRNLLNRCRRQPDQRLHVGELVIDRISRQVMVAGEEIELSRKEFLILCVLAEDPFRIFTKTELLSRVWGHDSTSHSRTLESHISRLRGKLDPGDRRYICNAWGVGYRLLEL